MMAQPVIDEKRNVKKGRLTYQNLNLLTSIIGVLSIDSCGILCSVIRIKPSELVIIF